MWGLAELAAGAVKLWGMFFGAKNAPDVKKAEQINAENERQQKFNEDIAIAADKTKSVEERQQALDRIRASVARTP